jgi:hypothetical protein
MTLISTVTVGAGGTSSILFSSIPQTYTDLLLLLQVRIEATDVGGQFAQIVCYPNNVSYPDTASSFRELYGNGNTVTSSSASGEYIRLGYVPSGTATSNVWSNIQVYMPNYSGSTNKTFSCDGVAENNGLNGIQSVIAGLRTNTAALSSLRIEIGRTLSQNSIASLYGITKGSGGATVS